MNSNVKNATLGRLAISTAMLLSCVGVAAGALANEQVRSQTVSFRDLNVDTPEGVQALYGRIHAAAKSVCYESDPVLGFAEMSCTRKAQADAIAKVDLPQLTAYYNSRNGDRTRQLIAAR